MAKNGISEGGVFSPKDFGRRIPTQEDLGFWVFWGTSRCSCQPAEPPHLLGWGPGGINTFFQASPTARGGGVLRKPLWVFTTFLIQMASHGS